jgi:hypothetical protein
VEERKRDVVQLVQEEALDAGRDVAEANPTRDPFDIEEKRDEGPFRPKKRPNLVRMRNFKNNLKSRLSKQPTSRVSLKDTFENPEEAEKMKVRHQQQQQQQQQEDQQQQRSQTRVQRKPLLEVKPMPVKLKAEMNELASQFPIHPR